MNSTEVPGFSHSNRFQLAVRLLIIADDANTVIDVVGCDCAPHPLAETVNSTSTVITCFNRLRIGQDHTECP